MLAEPSSQHYNYQGSIVQQSPLLYQQHSISRSENLNVQPLQNPNPYNQHSQYEQQQQPHAQYRSDENPAPAAQTFLSTFFRDHHQYISPISHGRPYFSAGEPFSTTPRSPPRLNAHRSVESVQKPVSFDTSILGSGDFGVLRGGTFYQDNDPTLFRSSESSNEFSYYNKNGHGRPQTAAYVQRYTYPEDQFANFRDFADINTPSDPAYSHFVVVYTNRNGTVVERPNGSAEAEEEEQGQRKYEPKNILDQLRLLDDERETTTARILKSKTKRKLKRTKLEKSYKKEKVLEKEPLQDELEEDTLRIDTDQIDPLLALS